MWLQYLLQPSILAPQPQQYFVFPQQWSWPCGGGPPSKTTLLYKPRGYLCIRGSTESGCFQLYFLERNRQELCGWYLQTIIITSVLTLCCVLNHVWLPGQVLQHFPADFRGCWHGYWLGHVMRLQSWRPSVQVHRMHSRTFPKTGCHMSPWEYVLPLYKHAETKWKTSEHCAACGSNPKVVSNRSIKSNTYTGSLFVLTKSHLFGVSAATKSSRWSPKPLWGSVCWGSGLWERSWPWVEWHGRTAPCSALQNTGRLNASFVNTDIIKHSYLPSPQLLALLAFPLSDSCRSIIMNNCPHLRFFQQFK